MYVCVCVYVGMYVCMYVCMYNTYTNNESNADTCYNSLKCPTHQCQNHSQLINARTIPRDICSMHPC